MHLSKKVFYEALYVSGEVNSRGQRLTCLALCGEADAGAYEVLRLGKAREGPSPGAWTAEARERRLQHRHYKHNLDITALSPTEPPSFEI